MTLKHFSEGVRHWNHFKGKKSSYNLSDLLWHNLKLDTEKNNLFYLLDMKKLTEMRRKFSKTIPQTKLFSLICNDSTKLWKNERG